MMTFLVSAGQLREDDDRLMMIQGLSLDQAQGVADWLAATTNGEVHLRHMDVGELHEIVSSPADVQWRRVGADSSLAAEPTDSPADATPSATPYRRDGGSPAAADDV